MRRIGDEAGLSTDESYGYIIHDMDMDMDMDMLLDATRTR